MIDHQNDQIKKKWEYDKKNYEYNWGVDRTKIKADGTVPDDAQLRNADGTKKGKYWENYYNSVESLRLKKAADQESRTYQEETARQNWEMGKSQQQYQWDQQDAVYQKSENQYNDVLQFNQIEYNDAIEREQSVLNEQFISAAFENQGLIADLYEATGTKGFDQAAHKLGILKQEELIESQSQKHLTNLRQSTEGAKYSQAGTKIGMLDQAGKTEFQQAGIVQDLFAKESANRFKKASLLMDADTQDRVAQFQNDLIRRENKNTYAKAAHESTERNLQALKAQGQAALTQAGRSQGKAVQMVLAELGRQNAYVAESLMRGSGAAEARMKQNIANTATFKQKAKLNLQQIAEDTGQNIERTLLNLEETERNLKIGNAKGELNLDQIRKQVYDNIESTTLDVKTLESNLRHAQSETGLNLKKIDWDIDNLGSRFKTNQDILKANLDSAVEASTMSRKDIARDLRQANLEAEAKRMLDPSAGRDAMNLDRFQPVNLPTPQYQPVQEPSLPPAPMEGAMMDSSTGAAGFAGAALSGTVAGLGAAAATANMTSLGALAGGPIGLGIGLLTFLSQL
tara:strand:- start:1929 stop:3638 length:1710 start_codon:yes stop_codon:yes gene_type:complete